MFLHAINTFYNSYYHYWDLITKFWPDSTKKNTPFPSSFQVTFSLQNPLCFLAFMRSLLGIFNLYYWELKDITGKFLILVFKNSFI